MNSSSKVPSKVATLDLQVNDLSKLLFLIVALASFAMVALPFLKTLQTAISLELDLYSTLRQRAWQSALDFGLFFLLFSQIIPISLRVALDTAKLVYKVQMSSDPKMPGMQVRSSALPEELGGVQYLLTDKTGTLTRNIMRFRKLHLGFACLSEDSVAELRVNVARSLDRGGDRRTSLPNPPSPYARGGLL